MKFTAAALALAATASAQTLQAVLSNNTQLSMLNNLTGALLAGVANTPNVTLFAPDNAAVSAFLNSSTAGAVGTNQALIQAILQYVTAAPSGQV